MLAKNSDVLIVLGEQRGLACKSTAPRAVCQLYAKHLVFSAECRSSAASLGEQCILSTDLTSEGSVVSPGGELESFAFH